jgi:hypothetical protein
VSELDDTLNRLFAEARQTLPADDFQERLAIAMSQARRRRKIAQLVLRAGAVGVAIAATPYVVTASLAGASNPGLWACSLALAAWSLRRARRTS